MADVTVWRCTAYWNEGDGGVNKEVVYATSKEEMIILKDQGYTCILLSEEDR